MAEKEKGHPLRSLIATTLQIIEADSCYIPPPKTGSSSPSTYTKVLAALKNGSMAVDEDFLRLADEILKFFQELPQKAEYKDIMARPDSAMYQTCIDIASQNEVLPNSIVFAVAMPNFYGKLRPRKPMGQVKIDEAEVTQPGSFMGHRETPGRFFVKLVRVGDLSKEFNGHCFEIRDRHQNIGLFYEKAERMKHILHLGDCFAMIATPMRHYEDDKGVKHTIFRTVEIVDNKGARSGVPDPDPSQDVTGLFTRT